MREVRLATVAIGFGTVGIIALQSLNSLADLGYLRRTRTRTGVPTCSAPLLSSACLWPFVPVVDNFDLLSGASNHWVKSLPPSLTVVFVTGVGYALRIKNRRPTQC